MVVCAFGPSVSDEATVVVMPGLEITLT
jgi:hypothetical protein